MPRPPIDRTGERFGRWTVLNKIAGNKFLCLCECGTERSVDIKELRRGKSKSCGCFQRENAAKQMTRHGMSKEAFYNVWSSMKKRCELKSHPSYKRYGGRGIRVVWRSFEEFHADMYASFRSGLSIERIDNDGPYSKDNCRWATPKEQARNRSTNVKLTIGGKTKLKSEWADEAGIGRDLLNWRVKKWGAVPEVIRKIKHKHHARTQR